MMAAEFCAYALKYMVFQKRLDYGSNGYQVPFVPRSARSVRKRKIFKRKAEDDQMCAFDLLATVAGKLLQEGEILPSPKSTAAVSGQLSIDKDTVKQEIQVQEKPLKVEPCDPGSCDESVFVSGLCFQVQKQNCGLEELQHSGNNVGLEQNSVIMSSACSEKARCPEARVAAYRNEFLKSSGKQVCIKRDGESPRKQVCIKRDGESPCKQVCRKQDGESHRRGQPCKGNVVDGNMRRLDSELQNVDMGIVVNGSVPYSCSSMYPMELDIKPPALASSDSSVEVPMCSDKIPHSSFILFRDDVKKLVSKDDDENSSGCTRPSTGNTKASRPPPRTGDRRIRKLLASKYRKAAPRLKDGELSHNELRPLFRNRRACYTRQRSERNFFKRRRMFERCSASLSEGGTSSDGFSNSSKMVIDGNSTGSASRSSSPATGQSPSSFHPRDSHVKLSIKSFRVPELFIEIPETATIGSLKRTVMEAVNAILGGGLHVGVVLQGKKVRDDNKTLLQTGIASDDKQGALGFTLEPNPAPAPVPQPLCPEDPPCIVPCSTPQPLASYTPPSTLDPAPSDTSLHPTLTNLGNFVESDRDSVPSQTNQSADISLGSRALVAIPTSVEALTVVPMHRKSRRSELAQRRIRRPFSVTEVEALVQAVEKLGTGRWRDVKLRAFDNAKHRTYVDLKDKWKTLVHTARISPQQRRGEPVPQEVLDRVLAAHAYWSQQAAKQQVKQQNQQTTTEACLLL